MRERSTSSSATPSSPSLAPPTNSRITWPARCAAPLPWTRSGKALWSSTQRSDSASRALASTPARRRFGNFGGPARFDYTAMGDTVNTAARLEALNKHLGTRVCVSGAAVSAAQARGEDLPPLRAVGSFVLKGKKEPIEVFEAVSEGTAALADLAGYRSAFDAMASGGRVPGRGVGVVGASGSCG